MVELESGSIQTMAELTSFEKVQTELFEFFEKLGELAKEEGWKRDREWTLGINKHIADFGHKYGFGVFASRCQGADGAEWLYDHHWRVIGPNGYLKRLPLVMEIEWGFGSNGLFENVRDDFLKLVQARADLRVIVFQGNRINNMVDQLINEAMCFAGGQIGDRYLFAGWGWDTSRIHCRLWSNGPAVEPG
jgi:hypothetical protein